MKARVLVASDEAGIVELLRFELTQQGYEAVVADSGLSALNQARRWLPDVILMDVMMEGLDGFTACDLLRHQPSTAHIPIIVLTAFSTESVPAWAQLVGVSDVITKPFSPRNLVERVELLLGRRRDSEPIEAEPALTEVRQGPVYGWNRRVETR